MTGYLNANVPSHVPGQSFEQQPGFPAITITRQAGARATSIGELLIEELKAESPFGGPPWTLFGKELINFVLRESNLPETLAKFFPEEGRHSFRESVEEIIGLHPSSFEFNQRCHRAIVNLCRLGHVIIIGRGANLLAKNMPNVLNVRLVGSFKNRVRHMCNCRDINEREAEALVKREDVLRSRYAKDNFSVSNTDDPLLYDLLVNTDELSNNAVARLIKDALYAKNADNPAISVMV